MKTVKKNLVQYGPTIANFTKTSSAIINGVKLTPGDVVKVNGAAGRFRFDSFVTSATGEEWVDCFELDGEAAMGLRSFSVERILPTKGKNAKRARISS